MTAETSFGEDSPDEITRRHLRAASEAISTIKRRLYVGGEWIESESKQSFRTHDPTTGNVLAEIQAGGGTDIETAVTAAWEAYRTEWGSYAAPDRQRILNSIADRVEDNKEKFQTIITLDNGKPITEAEREVELFVDQFRYFAGGCRFHEGSTVRSAEGHRIQTEKQPYGVVGQITPWNFPLLMVAWKVAPALATGNAVVLKPAEETPLPVLELVREIEDIVPPGVINVVTGHGPEAGSALVKHPETPKIAFTGSTEVGKGVMKRAASTVTDITLELGGKSPVVIYPDADIDRAVEMAIRAMFFNNGECCSAGTRLYIHDDIEAAFLSRFIDQIEALRLGDPLDPETDLGPQITPSQANKTMQYLRSLEDENCEILTGGYEPDDEKLQNGCFVAPTVIADIDHEAMAVQEEIFGPVEVVFTWEEYEEMIARANGVEYGLAAGIVTDDINRAYRTADDLDVGNVWVNTYNIFPSGQPFGGTKQSGIGREVAAETLDEYTQTKTVTVGIDDRMDSV